MTSLHSMYKAYLRKKGMYRQSEKKLNSNISFTCPYNMVKVGLLTSEIGWRVLGTPTNFNGFRYCTDVAQRRLTILCTMFGRLLGCTLSIQFLALLSRDGILPGAKFTLRPSVALSYIGSVTARHSNSGRQPNFAAWYLHATGRPSR